MHPHDQGPGETRPLGTRGDAQVLRFAALRPGALWAGRYEIREPLGAGGAGEVFRAFDRVAKADVALKVLYPRGGDGVEMMGRLRRELRLVRGVAHPGVVRVHDIGESEGLAFLVMELLRGETLRDRLKRGPLPPADAAALIGQALAALGAAHAAGIVHRDVKPANVFLAEPAPPPGTGPIHGAGLAPRVVLLDFGIARPSEGTQFTATGDFLGTPEYVAPEQARGERNVGPAADLYSLGVVAWEMLAGSPPFVADSAIEVLRAHAERPLPSPRASLRSAPGWLRDLVSWMLAKEPSRRPRDAAAALAFLEARRRRTLVRRVRLSLVRGVVAGAAAIAAAAVLFVPVRVQVDKDWRPVARSLAGLAVCRPDPLAGTRAALPLDPGAFWPRRHLLGIVPDGTLPLALLQFDLPFCRSRRFPLSSPELTRAPLERSFHDFADEYFAHDLVLLPWRSARGEPLYAATVRHRNYPSAALIFDGRGAVSTIAAHPGHLGNPIPVEPEADGTRGRDPIVVFGGVNRDADDRHVLVALEASAVVTTMLAGVIAIPPYAHPARPEARDPAFYTFLPEGRYGEERRSDDEIVVWLEDVGERRFDARTGAPKDGPDAAVPRAEWLSNQKALIEELRRTGDEAAHRDVESAAARLENFATRTGLAPSQRGVALGRAAVLWRRAGKIDRAIALTETALSNEPGIVGHRRRMVDLLVRAGRSGEALERSASWSVKPSCVEIARDRLLAALLSGDPGAVDQLPAGQASGRSFREGIPDWVTLVNDLHRARFDDASRFLSTRSLDADPDLAFPAALAFALADPPRLADAERALRIAETTKGAGRTPPFATLRAYLALRRGSPGTGSTTAEIEGELARIAAAAREDLADWYFEAWAHALAARVFERRGDEARARRERAAAEGHRGAGAYRERVYSLGSTVSTAASRRVVPPSTPR